MQSKKVKDDFSDKKNITSEFYPRVQLQNQDFLNGKLRCEKCHVIVCFEFMRRIGNQNLCYACYDDCQISGCYNPSVYNCRKCDIRLCNNCFIWDFKGEGRLCRVCEEENIKEERDDLVYLKNQVIYLKSQLHKKDKKIKQMQMELYSLKNEV